MQVNKILFITLSNIGDVILTLPALDCLRESFPDSKVTVMAGPRPKEIFENNPYIDRLIIYDKHAKLREKAGLFNKLKKENFDMVIDLRNSLFGALLPVPYKTSPYLSVPRKIRHMRDRHFYRLQAVTSGYKRLQALMHRKTLWISPGDEEYIEELLRRSSITEKDKIVIVACGARSHIKRWDKDKFVDLISKIINEFNAKVILVGDKDDVSITEYITERLKYPILNVAAKTNIAQLACLLKKASLLVTNDSAVLHLGSYLNTPIVAIFGPTNEAKYSPWSDNCAIVKKEIFCRPCEKAQCRFGTLECMSIIKAEDVLREVRNILAVSCQLSAVSQENKFKRILITRTDRIGDVLLSTPVIKALRDTYPDAYLAMMVSPYAKDILDGNPYLDKVIIYGKDARHKSWINSLSFAFSLKKKKFDLAIVLHPTNRVHLATFFAGIRRRIGYDRKLGFLLTDRIKHTKQLGEKHELEYNLDILRHLGLKPQDKKLFMPIKAESEEWVEQLFAKVGINKSDRLLAVHPGASCISKVWPTERFAQVADSLIEKYNFKVFIIAGPKDIAKASGVIKNMHHPAINLAGMTSVSQLASLLKRCRLFISNDSGPVHIASSVGTPVISIFGRNQKGLSPVRWGPLGENSHVLHKEVGCVECLAHNCEEDFACLKAISAEEVLDTCKIYKLI